MNEIKRVDRKYSVLNDIPVGVCILKHDYTVLFWNKMLKEFTNISSEIIVGKSILSFFPKFNKYSYNTLIQEVFKGGPPVILSSQLHKSMFLTTENTDKSHNVIIKALHSNLVNEYYALFSIDDVTGLTNKIIDYKSMRDKAYEEIEHRKIIERKLKESQANLEELNKTKDKFFSIIAHDLKNPISSFKNLSELLTDQYDHLTEEELKEFIGLMSESSNNLFKLLENLLMWSRAQVGSINMNKEEFIINDIVRNNLLLMKLNAENKKIKLVNNIEKDIAVFGDINMLDTVIRNLISNALKFSDAGDKITIDAEISEDIVTMKISDTGVGMPPEIQEKLFKIDKQITSIGTQQERGTGLGLILCKEFINKNNGDIWVESEQGKGSTFFFTVPKTDINS
jgi:two-component system sensor histidine kinase/response regulator